MEGQENHKTQINERKKNAFDRPPTFCAMQTPTFKNSIQSYNKQRSTAHQDSQTSPDFLKDTIHREIDHLESQAIHEHNLLEDQIQQLEYASQTKFQHFRSKLLFIIGQFTLSRTVLEAEWPILGVDTPTEDLFARLIELSRLFLEVEN